MEGRTIYTEDYKNKQRENLNKFSKEDLIDFLLESREQRDNYQNLCFEFKKVSETHKFNYDTLVRDIKKVFRK